MLSRVANKTLCGLVVGIIVTSYLVSLSQFAGI